MGSVEESIADAMETDVRLLPVLAELLADLSELGSPAKDVVSALRPCGLKPGASALDLACGKGPVAVALARELGLQVEGVDAFAPFLRAARTLARESGVAARCEFRRHDIRGLLGRNAHYDVVLLLSIGPIRGDHENTMGDLRSLVRPEGYIVIDDGFLADGVEELPGCEGYAHRDETVRRLTAHGDVLLSEIVRSPQSTRAENERNTALIRRRAESIKRARPELRSLVDAYVARQERETEILGKELVCAQWLLQRSH